MEGWTVRLIAAQAFGILGMAMNISSYQAKERRQVILVQLFGSTFFAINMLLLGAYSGFLLNVTGILRALIYSRDSVARRVNVWNAAFVALYALSYAAVFIVFKKPLTALNFVIELLPTLAMSVSTLALARSAAVIRRCVFVSSPCWLIYNCVNGSIGGIVCEALSLGSAVAGMIRLDRKAGGEKGE